MNGTMDSNGMPSQGDQELAQKENENQKTSMQQNNAEIFLNKFTRKILINFLIESYLNKELIILSPMVKQLRLTKV